MIKQEISGEQKYGINTTGADELNKLEEMGIDVSHATIYMPVSFSLMEEIFQQLKSKPAKLPQSSKLSKPSKPHSQEPSDKLQTTDRALRANYKPLNHFLDLGCGKGRAMCMAAHHGFNKVSGIDLSKDLCLSAEANLSKTKKQFPLLQYKVINNDAFYYEIPQDADCIFFFNPFDEIIMSAVVNNIFESLEDNPRKLRIIYVNPLHKEQFIKAGYKETWYSKKLKYIEAVILEN